MAEEVRIDLVANDDASKTIEHVADETAKLEKLSPEVAVTANTAAADRDLKNVGETASRLESNDVVIALRAQIDQLKGQTKEAEAALGKVSDQADDTNRHLDKIGGEGGLHTRGQAIADLTGPLGDASGAASDFAGVFDGLSDIAGDVAGKVGLSAAAMETAIGGIGIVVAAAAAAWTIFQGQQAKTREEQKKVTKAVEETVAAVKKGDLLAAAKSLTDAYGPLIAKATEAGVSIQTVTDYIRGQGDESAQLAQILATTNQQVVLGGESVNALAQSLESARDAYTKANGSADEQARTLGEVQRALGLTATKQDAVTTSIDRTKAAMDKLRGALTLEQEARAVQSQLDTIFWNFASGVGTSRDDILTLKSSIIDLGETAGKTPVQIQAELTKVDQGNLIQVQTDVQSWYVAHPVKLATALQNPDLRAKGGSAGFTPVPMGMAPSVTVNMPAGSSGVDVVRQIGGQTRRNGRRYGAPVVRATR